MAVDLHSFETLVSRRDDNGVLTLWLARPEKRNAISAKMIEELTEFTRLMADDPARVIVLRGQGDVFCAGGDLAWMKAQMQADRATRVCEAKKLALMLNALNLMPKPVIGVVQGSAFGGGVGMMAVCDLVIAENTAKFGLTETRLGLIPATISPYLLARMGEGAARQVLMSARIFCVEEAKSLGLISVATDDIEAEVTAQIKPFLSVAPQAVASTKKLIRSMGMKINEDVIETTIEALADIWETDEAVAGIDAFFKKVPAPWVISSK